MKKYILILLLFTGFIQAQTYPTNPTAFGKVAIKNNSVSTSTTKINTQEADGQVNYIDAVNLPVPASVINALDVKTTNSAGAIQGFAITNNGNGTVNIASGTAYLRATNDQYAQLVKYTIPAVTNLTLTDNANNFVLVDYNGGVPALTVTTNSATINTETNSLMSVISRVGTTLDYVSLVGQNNDANAKIRIRFLNQEGIRRANGAVIGFANRNLTLTAGTLFSGLIRINSPAFNTASPDTFTYVYNNGSVWTRVASQTQVDNTQYNNTGTLATMPNNTFRVDYIYLLPNNPSKLYVVYGNTTYANITTARNAPIPSSLPSELQVLGLLVGRQIIEKNAVAISEVSSAFNDVFTGVGVPEHNALAGLQGGTTNDYQHLNTAQLNGLIQKNTIAQIRAFSGTLSNTLFYTTDLGQEGNWYYDASDTTSADNTGTVLVTSDGKRIKRVIQSFVYPEWFGAKGDGTTDDTSSLQSTLDAGYKVRINKNKTFLYSATLVLKDNCILEGEDNKTSILKPKIDTFTFRNNFNPATIVNSKAKISTNSDDFSDPNSFISINNIRVEMSSDITSNMQSILRFSAMINLKITNCTFMVSSTTAKSHNAIIDLHAAYRDVLVDGNTFDITTNSITSGGAIWVQNEGDVDCEKVQVSNNIFNVASKDETLAIYTINGLGQVKNARAFNNTLTKPLGTTSPSSMLTVFGNVDNINVYRNYLYSNQASGLIDGMIRVGISSDATNTGKPNNVNIEFNKVIGVFTTSKGIIGYSGNVVKLKGNTVISTDLTATTNLGIVTPSSGLSQNWVVIGNEITNFSTAITGGSVIESNIINNAFIGAVSYRKITDNVFNGVKTRCVQLPALGNTEIYEISGNQFNTTNTATDVIGFATGTIGMGKNYIGKNIFKGTTGGTATKGITQISGSGTTGTTQEDNNTFTLPGVSYDITVFNTLVTSGNLAGLASTSTARNNLGLGSIATQSSNSVTFGGATKSTIFNGTTFFSNVTPIFSISPISPVSTTYEELFVMRSPNNSASAVLRRLGLMFKLSDESSNTESLKSGGIIVESSLGFANQPSLSLVIGSLKPLTIDFSGNSLFTGVVKGSNGVASNDFVTKSQLDLKADLASPALTGTPTAPTAIAGTNTTQIATTAFVTTASASATRPYKSYLAYISQSGTSAPTVARLFENTLGGTIVWTRTATGRYTGTLTGLLTLAKTSITASNRVTSNPPDHNDDEVYLVNKDFTGTDTDTMYSLVEIRVYN